MFNSLLSSLNPHLYAGVRAKPIVLSMEVFNLRFESEVLKRSVMIHELSHFDCLRNTSFRRGLLVNLISLEAGAGFDRSYVDGFNRYMVPLYEALAYFVQLRSPHTPIELARSILDSLSGEVLDFLRLVDGLYVELVSRTKDVSGVLSFMELVLGICRCIRNLELLGMSFRDIRDALVKGLKALDVPSFDSPDKWGDFIAERILPSEAVLREMDVVDIFYDFWLKLRDFMNFTFFRSYVLGVLDEFGVPAPIVFLEVDDLENPGHMVIDTCIIPEDEGFISELIALSKKYRRDTVEYDRFISFLKSIWEMRFLVSECKGKRCHGRRGCRLIYKVFNRLQNIAL